MLGVGVLVSSITLNLYMAHKLEASVRALEQCSNTNLSLSTSIGVMQSTEALRGDVGDSLHIANMVVDNEVQGIREAVRVIRDSHANTNQCRDEENEDANTVYSGIQEVPNNSSRRLSDESIKLLKSRVHND